MKLSLWKLPLILFFILYSLFFIHPSYAHAQYTQTTNQNPYLNPNTESNVPANLHTYTQSVVLEALDAVSCFVTGVDFLNPSGGKCLGINTQNGKLGYASSGGGLLPIVGRMLTFVYTPPFHTVDFVAFESHNFIKNRSTSYAQNAVPAATEGTNTGLGFQGLTPLVGVWSSFRNIVYLIFTVFFVLLGLAIMLRLRIDPKTTVSIENTLPRIVITLLLVTFSFAIAGLMIDLMYVGSYLVVTVMQSVDPAPQGQYNSPPYPATGIDSKYVLSHLNRTPLGFSDYVYHGAGDNDWGLFGIVGSATNAVDQVVANLMTELVDNNQFLAVLIGIFNIGCWGSKVFTIVPPPDVGGIDWKQCAGGFVAWAAQLFIWLALYFALLSALFRLWFSMMKAYVLILIETVLAPFIIGLGIFPGATGGFGGWLRGLLANLALFPASIFMFLLAKIFIDKLVVTTGTGGAGGEFFIPPLLGNLLNPNGTQLNYIGAILAFAILLLMPTLLEQIREKLQVQANKYYGPAIGTALAAGSAGAGIVAGKTWSTLTREENTKQGIKEGLGRKLALGGLDSRRRAAFRSIKGRLGLGSTDKRSSGK